MGPIEANSGSCYLKHRLAISLFETPPASENPRCMIKIFWGGAGVVTPLKSPSSYEQLLPLPTPCFNIFLERCLNDPPPPHFKNLSLQPPSPSTIPPQKKTTDFGLFLVSLETDLWEV